MEEIVEKIKCSNCNVDKDLNKYYKGHKQCKDCISLKSKIHQEKNKEKINANYKRKIKKLKIDYNLLK